MRLHSLAPHANYLHKCSKRKKKKRTDDFRIASLSSRHNVFLYIFIYIYIYSIYIYIHIFIYLVFIYLYIYIIYMRESIRNT